MWLQGANCFLPAMALEDIMTTELAPKRGPGRPPFAETVATVKAKAQSAPGAKRGRLSMEDLGNNPSPGSFTCTICPAWFWKVSDLFQHAEEQHQAVGTIP